MLSVNSRFRVLGFGFTAQGLQDLGLFVEGGGTPYRILNPKADLDPKEPTLFRAPDYDFRIFWVLKR